MTDMEKLASGDYTLLEQGLDGLKGTGIDLVFQAIAKTAKLISNQLSFRVGMTERINPFGEKQAELDVFSNESFVNSLMEINEVGYVASEELETPKAKRDAGKESLAIAMDPIDGSSNIPTNNPLGSIFGVWRGPLPQPGRNLLASGFVTYGPTLSITMTNGRSVDQFIELRDGKEAGKFALAYRSMKLPEDPEVYGFGGTRSDWVPQVERFVSGLEARGMHLRYGGTFIGDYNQILQRGGIFSYPAHKSKPRGKLRIMYETAPISYLTQLAGGSSSDGEKSILEIEPKKLSETSPFYVGNTSLIRELEAALR